MTTTIKCRLHPTRRWQLEQTLDGSRWFYNYFRKIPMLVEDMQYSLVELKESYSRLRNCLNKMLQIVVNQMDEAKSVLEPC